MNCQLAPPRLQIPLSHLEAIVVAAHIFYAIALELGDALGVEHQLLELAVDSST